MYLQDADKAMSCLVQLKNAEKMERSPTKVSCFAS